MKSIQEIYESIVVERQMKRVINVKDLIELDRGQGIEFEPNIEKILKNNINSKAELIIKGSSGPETAFVKIKGDTIQYQIDKKYIGDLMDEFFD